MTTSTTRTAARATRLSASALGLALLGAGLVGTAPAQAATGPAWRSCPGLLDGVVPHITPTTSSVVTVHHTSGSYARVTLWKRLAGRPCHFSQVFAERDARVGSGGMVDGTRRRQGTNTTPRGVYTMTTSFGVGPGPSTALPYRRVAANDYWVEDNASPWYNTYRSSSQGGFRTASAYSERLAGYPTQYRYAVVVNYNMPPAAVRFRGAGIFLHVKGKGATAGCVSVTLAHMQQVMGTVRPGDLIGIVG